MALLEGLETRLAAASSERECISVALDGLLLLCPSSVGRAAACFSLDSALLGEGSARRVADCRVAAASSDWAAAIAAALPPDVAAQPESSVTFVCDPGVDGDSDDACLLADSRQLPKGVLEFSDWAHGAGAVSPARPGAISALTAPLVAGDTGLFLGFVAVFFDDRGGGPPMPAPLARLADAASLAWGGGSASSHVLESFLSAVGAALFLRRATAGSSPSLAADDPGSPRIGLGVGGKRRPLRVAVSGDRAARLSASSQASLSTEQRSELSQVGTPVALASPPPPRGTSSSGSLELRVADADAAAEDEATLKELDAQLGEARQLLGHWGTDAWMLPQERLPQLAVLMFHAQGLLRDCRLRPAALAEFVAAVAKSYQPNPYHCWRHAWTARARQ